MALTTTPPPPLVATVIGLASSPLLHGVEKATQTFKKGAFVQDDDAGRITESATPIDASAVTKRAFGLAVQDAVGTVGTDTIFNWLGPQTPIEITLSNATTGTHILAQADQWQVFPILKDTGSPNQVGSWYLDANAVSNTGGAVVVGFKGAIGDVDARVYAILTNTARGGAHAASGTF